MVSVSLKWPESRGSEDQHHVGDERNSLGLARAGLTETTALHESGCSLIHEATSLSGIDL
jgi:hypothetical protein